MAADQSFAAANHAMVMMAFSDSAIVPTSAIATELSLSPVVVGWKTALFRSAGTARFIA
jgi:DNA-binding IscR family transcriptional regulator